MEEHEMKRMATTNEKNGEPVPLEKAVLLSTLPEMFPAVFESPW